MKRMPSEGYKNVSLKETLLAELDAIPGKSRSEKIERLIKSVTDGRDRLGMESQDAITSCIVSKWSRQQKIDLIVEVVKSLK